MLTQAEVDALIKMLKKKAANVYYEFPSSEEILSISIVLINEKETFLIDINRKGKIRFTKCSYQERYKGIIILVQLDIDSSPHTNPEVSQVPLPYLNQYNGQTIQCPHLHLYVEGFMDKWAISAPKDKFSHTNDIYETLMDFFSFCNIIDPPIIEKGLF